MKSNIFWVWYGSLHNSNNFNCKIQFLSPKAQNNKNDDLDNRLYNKNRKFQTKIAWHDGKQKVNVHCYLFTYCVMKNPQKLPDRNYNPKNNYL